MRAAGRMEREERRISRTSPLARLRPGWLGFYPTILPDVWYRLHTASGSHPSYVWLETTHGITRVQRADVEFRDGL